MTKPLPADALATVADLRRLESRLAALEDRRDLTDRRLVRLEGSMTGTEFSEVMNAQRDLERRRELLRGAIGVFCRSMGFEAEIKEGR